MDRDLRTIRRASFKAGISASTFRAQREERAISISKEKRSSKTNSLRKKLNDPEEGAPLPTNYAELDLYKSLIFSDAIEQQYSGAVCFRKLLASDGNVPYDFVLQPGIISRLCSFLSYRGDHVLDLLNEIAWVCTNIACGGHAHVKSLVESHAVELLLEVLTIKHPKAGGLIEQALWALGNIAVDSADARIFLIQKQIVSCMLSIVGGEINLVPRITVCPREMEEPSLSAVKHIAWICSTLVSIKNDSPVAAVYLDYDEVARPLVFMLTEFLQSPDNDVQADAYNGLSALFDAPQRTGTDSSESHIKCIQWALEEGVLFKLTETLESDFLMPPPPPPSEIPRPPRGSPRPSPLRVDTLPGQTVFTFNESFDSSNSTPDNTPGKGMTDTQNPFFPPLLSNGSRHGGKHVRRNSKEGSSDSPSFFRDVETRNRSVSGESRLVPPLRLDPTVLEPVECFKSFTHSPGTGSTLAGGGLGSSGPIAAVMDTIAAIPLGSINEVGEIDVIKNIFERNGRSPPRNSRLVANRSDSTSIKMSLSRPTGYQRLNENPLKLAAIHTAAILLSSSDVIQQQTIMLPRYDLLGKIVQLVAQDIQMSGITRGLFVEPEAALVAGSTEMEIAVDGGNEDLPLPVANIGGSSSVVYDVMTCIVAVLRGTRKHSDYYLKQILSGHKLLDVLEYFFGRDHYETTLVTGEAFFLIVQELICSTNEIVKLLTIREHTMIYNRLLELMTIADHRFISCLLATMFDLLLFFDKLNNAETEGRYGCGSYSHFFRSVDRLNNLLNHPSQDIASAAEKVEDLLEKLAARNDV